MSQDHSAIDENRVLYHEKQVAALCGVHCVNTLLQGPYFTEVELSQIAHELDALERQFMQEGGMESDDYKKFISEESGNVAADGMFSIQVLSKALGVWNLQVIPLDSPEVRATAGAEPHNEYAFVCNLQEHWFTIRKVLDSWWNFNSLFPAPQALSEFYLAAFLDTLKEQGYTIFVVRGALPPLNNSRLDGAGKWYTVDEARKLHEDADKARQKGRLANALETALSQLTSQGTTVTLKPRGGTAPAGDGAGPSEAVQDDFGVFEDEDGMTEEDRQLNEAIAASLADTWGAPANTGPGSSSVEALNTAGTAPSIDMDDDEDMDPELAAAIAASLSDMQGQPGRDPQVNRGAAAERLEEAFPIPGPAPEAGEGALEIAFRLQDGKRLMRCFNSTDTVAMLYGFLRQEGVDISQRQLANQFPRKAYPPSSTTLADAGIENRSALGLELIT